MLSRLYHTAAHSLCTLRSQRRRWTTQHSVPAGRYSFAGQANILLRRQRGFRSLHVFFLLAQADPGALKSHYHEQAMFPSGTAEPTPTVACCEGPNHKCPVSSGDWLSNPVWSAIDFELTEPSLFQYAYESKDGQTAVARAIGDLDCDGTTVTYEVRCEAKEGNPICTLTTPDKAD